MPWKSIIVAVIVFGIFIAIIINEIIKRKKGKGSCGCGCEGCAMKNYCHKTDKK